MRFALLVLCLISLLSIQDLSGQDRKGKFWVNGALGRNLIEDGTSTSNKIGYFLHDKLLVGSEITSSFIYSQESILDIEATISPFVRLYFGNSEWRPYGEAMLNLPLIPNREEVTGKVSVGVDREIVQGVLVGIEMAYNVNSTFAPDLSLGVNLNALLGGYDAQNAASEQLRKGSWSFGGDPLNLTFRRRDISSLNFYRIQLRPEFAHFLTNKLMVDVGVEMDFSRYNFDAPVRVSSSLPRSSFYLSAEVGLRRYFTTAKKVNFFVQGGLRFFNENTKRELLLNDGSVSISTASLSMLNANLSLGGTFFLNRHTSMDFGLKIENGLINDNSGIIPSAFVAFRFWDKQKE